MTTYFAMEKKNSKKPFPSVKWPRIKSVQLGAVALTAIIFAQIKLNAGERAAEAIESKTNALLPLPQAPVKNAEVIVQVKKAFAELKPLAASLRDKEIKDRILFMKSTIAIINEREWPFSESKELRKMLCSASDFHEQTEALLMNIHLSSRAPASFSLATNEDALFMLGVSAESHNMSLQKFIKRHSLIIKGRAEFAINEPEFSPPIRGKRVVDDQFEFKAINKTGNTLKYKEVYELQTKSQGILIFESYYNQYASLSRIVIRDSGEKANSICDIFLSEHELSNPIEGVAEKIRKEMGIPLLIALDRSAPWPQSLGYCHSRDPSRRIDFYIYILPLLPKRARQDWIDNNKRKERACIHQGGWSVHLQSRNAKSVSSITLQVEP